MGQSWDPADHSGAESPTGSYRGQEFDPDNKMAADAHWAKQGNCTVEGLYERTDVFHMPSGSYQVPIPVLR
jgi:hypothetical protein